MIFWINTVLQTLILTTPNILMVKCFEQFIVMQFTNLFWSKLVAPTSISINVHALYEQLIVLHTRIHELTFSAALLVNDFKWSQWTEALFLFKCGPLLLPFQPSFSKWGLRLWEFFRRVRLSYASNTTEYLQTLLNRHILI